MMALQTLCLSVVLTLATHGAGPLPSPKGSSPRQSEGSEIRAEHSSASADTLSTRLVLLGTGTPNAEPERAGSALAVVVDDVPYLVDAGPGIVRRANAAHEAGVEAMEVSRLATVFLTHLHSDHTLGLPDLLYSPWVLGRDVPLRVLGPAGTADMVHHLEEAYRRDVQVRLQGLEPANEMGYRAEVKEVEPGVVYEDQRVRVIAFPVKHGAWDRAFGYRFETRDRVIVISGDTAPTDAVVDHCRGCDVLVHEVYARSGWEGRAPAWQRYHAASHTSGIELGGLAARARPGLLVLTHQLLWGATPEELVAEVRKSFQGRVVYGRDLQVY